MAYRNLQDIVNNVITEIGLVAGSGVQTYTEPQCVLAVNRIFDYLLGKQEFDHLVTWERYTLDGVTGTVVEPMDTIRDALDIFEVRPLHRLPAITRAIGTNYLDAQGTNALFFSTLAWNDVNADKLVRFWPVTATGTVDIRALHRPDAFLVGEDIVPFDPLVIETGAAWYVLQGDGMNAGNAEKMQVIFDLAYQNYVSRLNKLEIGHGIGYRDGTVSLRQ